MSNSSANRRCPSLNILSTKPGEAHPHVSEEHKAQLRETYEVLDLVSLRQQINDLQSQLLDSVSIL
jgi:hypothetical protein